MPVHGLAQHCEIKNLGATNPIKGTAYEGSGVAELMDLSHNVNEGRDPLGVPNGVHLLDTVELDTEESRNTATLNDRFAQNKG